MSKRKSQRLLKIENLESRRVFSADPLWAAGDLSGQDNTQSMAVLGTTPAIPHREELPILWDKGLAAAEQTLSSVAGLAGAGLPLGSIPVLNSLVGAAASLYLDFDGHFDAQWGPDTNISTAAYDQDGDASTFSTSELASIRAIWEFVAEDYAPFNINVTTVMPASFADGTSLRVVIGGDGAWTGGSYGGVGYIDSFTNHMPNSVYVFSGNLYNGFAKYVADAASHEAGHAFGLEHQSSYDRYGRKIEEYSSGVGDGTAPIMGNSYDAIRSIWYSGATALGPTAYQDDMAMIARSVNRFGYRADDHGNSVATGTALVTFDNRLSSSGIIGRTSDLDVFSFNTGAGEVKFSIGVPGQFANLDARLELRNAAGTVIASAAPTTSLGATIAATVAAGTYYVVVGSEGYYGDVGQYTLTGSVVEAVQSINAPSALTATSTAGGQVQLTWTDNAANETGYTLERSTDGITWAIVATLPVDSASYTDSTVAAGMAYQYRVQAFNASQTSAPSNVATVTTAPAAPTGLGATVVSSSRIDLAWSNVAGESGYKIERSQDGVNWQQIATTGANVTTYQVTGLLANSTYLFRVRATNAGGDSAFSNTVSAKTLAELATPTAPSSLGARVISSTRVQLTWRDNSTNEKGFAVYRSADRGRTWAYIGQVGANVTAAVDTRVSAGRVYYYRLRAFNDAGVSGISNTAGVATPRYSLTRLSRALGLNYAQTASSTETQPAVLAKSSPRQDPALKLALSPAEPTSRSSLDSYRKQASVQQAAETRTKKLALLQNERVEQLAERLTTKFSSMNGNWSENVDDLFANEDFALGQSLANVLKRRS